VVRTHKPLRRLVRSAGMRVLRNAGLFVVAPTLIALAITLGLTSFSAH